VTNQLLESCFNSEEESILGLFYLSNFVNKTSKSWIFVAFTALTLLVERQEGHLGYKKLSDGLLAWLYACVNVQICIWPSWCHCHSLSLSPENPNWIYLPGFIFLVPAHPGSPGQNPRGP